MNFLIFILIYGFLILLLQSVNDYAEYETLKWKYRQTIRPVYIKSKFINKIKKGTQMALVYEVSCASPVSGDVVSRILTVSVNGAEVAVNNYDATATNLGELSFSQGDNVALALVDVDDAGNKSSAAVVEFVAQDTIPPESPAGFGVKLVREE